MGKLKFLLLIGLFGVSSFSVFSKSNIGIALKGSTVGLGGDIVVGFHPKMDVRLGFETMGYSLDFSFEESDVTYDAIGKTRFGTISALYDYYLAKNIFVTAGFGYNMFHLNIDGQAVSDLPWGDISIPKEKIGDFEFDITPSMKISPYLGIGFGQPLNPNKTVAFAFELGTFYQGAPNISIYSTGLLSPTMNPEQGQKQLLEYQISQYYLYPVVKMSLSFKLASF